MSKKSIINVLGADKLIQTNQPAEGEVLKSKKNIFIITNVEEVEVTNSPSSFLSNYQDKEFKGHFLKEAIFPSSYWRTLGFFCHFPQGNRLHWILVEEVFLSSPKMPNSMNGTFTDLVKPELNLFLVFFLLFTSHYHQIFILSLYFCLQSESYTEMMATTSWEI